MSRAHRLLTASAAGLAPLQKRIRATAECLEPRRLLTVAPISAEFQISDNIVNGAQTSASVATAADGSFVVAYLGQSFTGGQIDVFMRRFDNDGNPIAGAVPVNQFTTGDQSRPAIGMEDNGDFAIAWLDHENSQIMARRYNAAGTALGNEFQVSVNSVGTNFDVNRPDLAMDANGDFVVTWARDVAGDDDIKYRVYNNAGTAVTSELQANTTTTGVQSKVEVCMDDAGTFVITWQSAGADGSGTGVRARQFDVAGAATTSEFGVNTFTTGDQHEPSIGNDDTGEFVIAWTSEGQDGSLGGVYAKRFNDLGVAQGGEFRVNTVTTDDQELPSVAVDDFGDFVIAFDSNLQDGSQEGIFARGYEADGTSDGGVFPVNTVTNGIQFDAAATFDEATNKIVIAWTSNGGVKARRYIMDRINPAAPSTPDLFPTSDTGTSSSDNLTNDTTPTFLSIGEDDSTLELFVDGVLANTDFAASGNHLVSVPASFNLSDGTHDITARQLDQAGNESPLSGTLQIVIDTVAPATPGPVDLLASSDSGFSSLDNITNDTTPAVQGTGVNGTIVEVIEGSTVLGSDTVSSGVYAMTLTPLADGVHPLQARALDIAGNASVPTTALNVTIDTVAPAAPSIPPDLVDASDSGTSSTDNITNDTTPTFTGTRTPNDIVRLFVDNVLRVSDAIANSSTWTLTTSLTGDGQHAVNVKFEDRAGNLSGPGSSLTVLLDTTAPNAPTVAPDLSASSDTGASNTDNITNDTTPTLTGSVPANDIVRLFAGTALVGSDTTTSTGSYSITSSVLTDGVQSFTARFEDVAGNQSSASPALDVTIDTLPPSFSDGAMLFTPSQELRFFYNSPIAANSVTNTDLLLQNLTDATTVPAGSIAASVVSSSIVAFTFPGLPGGILPDGSYRGTLAAGAITDIAGNPTTVPAVYNFIWSDGTAASDAYRVATSADGQTVEVFQNSTTPVYTAAKATLGTIGLDGAGGDDTITVDLGRGNPITADGMTALGGSGRDTIAMVGSTVADAFNFNAADVVIGNSVRVSHQAMEAAQLNGAGGFDFVLVTGGPALEMVGTQQFQSLTLVNGSDASMAPNGSNVLVTRSLGLSSTSALDLNDNDLLLDYTGASQLATIQNLIVTARSGGAWGGNGITSSAARNANPRNTMLGLMEATEFQSIYGAGAPFDGQPLDTTAVLVKYTYYGDSDFNGRVNFDDYVRTDNGFNNHRSGWMNGDFDLNGSVNFDDYVLLDLAFNTQSGVL
jgi:hypothetical protein